MIDCACVITGDKYDFEYVHKLYKGLCRGFTNDVTLHVYTEESRKVPKPYVKHSLKTIQTREDRGWWNKIQLFNPKLFRGQLLYFDLDVVILNSLDWMLELDSKYFWSVRDFRYLWAERRNEVNSSVMYFDTEKFSYVWSDFKKTPEVYMNRLHGDQNFIHRHIPSQIKQFFDINRVKSYKWELIDGGYDMHSRTYKEPGSGTKIPRLTSIAVFHGQPNPDDIIENDSIIAKYWC